MKTKVLLDAVNSVLPGTTAKGLVDGGNMIVILKGELIAYNDRISVSTFVEGEGLDIECAINAVDFKNVIKGIKEDEIDLSMADNILSIVSEKTEAEIPVTSEVKNILAMIKKLDVGSLNFEDLPKDFNEGLNLTRFNVSDDYADVNNLFCLCIDGSFMYASDDYRLSRYELLTPISFSCLIPKNDLQDLASFKPLGIATSLGWVHFIDQYDSVFSCRTVMGKYPITEKLFESFEAEATPITLPDELKTTLEDITPLYDEVLASHKGIKLEVKDDVLYCEIEKEKVWVKKKLKLPGTGNPNVSFMLSSVFLTEILSYTSIVMVTDRQAIFETEVFKHVILLQLKEA
jgi:hypothetical protein